MQPDIDETSTTSAHGGGMPYNRTNPMTGERQFTDYVSDFGDTVSTGTGRIINYFIDHPLFGGSLVVGGIGAFLGSRLGYVLAMRQRKSFYDKAMDTIGLWVAMLGTMMSAKNRERAMGRLVDTGRSVMGSSQDVRSSVMDRLPERVPLDRLPLDRFKFVEKVKPEEKPSVIKQIGYGLSLIPLTMALIRNPLVRDIGFRFLAKRMQPRRR